MNMENPFNNHYKKETSQQSLREQIEERDAQQKEEIKAYEDVQKQERERYDKEFVDMKERYTAQETLNDIESPQEKTVQLTEQIKTIKEQELTGRERIKQFFSGTLNVVKAPLIAGTMGLTVLGIGHGISGGAKSGTKGFFQMFEALKGKQYNQENDRWYNSKNL